MQRVGVVLAGGGGKGAYEVGAWLALEKIFNETNIQCYSFSGASVGALNAALFACSSSKEIEGVWDSVTVSKILSTDISDLIKNIPHFTLAKLIAKETIKKVIAMGTRSVLVELGLDGARIAQNIYKNGLFNRKGLSKIIDDANIKYRIDKTSDVFASCYSQERKEVEYIKVDSSNCIDVLLATSAIPGVFGMQNVEGEKYRDGGVPKAGDNLPIKPLRNITARDQVCNKFVVIHLDDNDQESFRNIDLHGCKLYHIFPEGNLDGIFGTFDFTQKGIQKRKKQGISDVEKDYNYIEDIKRFFSDDSECEQHFSKGKCYSNIDLLYAGINENINVESNESLAASFKMNKEVICVKNKELQKLIIKLKSLDEKQIGVVIGALTEFLALAISSVLT